MVSRNNNSIPYAVPPDGAAPPIVVLKFGSSVLNREDGLAAVVQDRIEGVLNGTCNFILERLGEGLDFDVALREAQEQGFAEARCREHEEVCS